MSSREAFLGRVRSAVLEGNRAGTIPPHPGRSVVGYQGAGADPIAKFCKEFEAAGGFPFVAENDDDARRKVQEIAERHQAKNIVVGVGPLMDRLFAGMVSTDPKSDLTNGQQTSRPRWRTTDQADKEAYFASDLGISTVEHLIAETGTVVAATRPDQPRSISLLPPVHIAIARKSQILPDLFDLFDVFSPTSASSNPPACLTLITGPSKTGDIELKLVTGVHGPGEIHVILVD